MNDPTVVFKVLNNFEYDIPSSVTLALHLINSEKEKK
jgi:hypothetical protein